MFLKHFTLSRYNIKYKIKKHFQLLMLPLKYHTKLPILPVMALTLAALISANVFGDPTLAAFFCYSICGTVLFITACIFYFKSNTKAVFPAPLPILLFGVLWVYYWLQSLIIVSPSFNNRHWFLLVNFFVLFSYCILYNTQKISFQNVCTVITIIAGGEAIICLAQYFGLLPVHDSLYKITGSGTNPNITGMFLAMALPAVLLVTFKSSPVYQKLSLGVLFFMIAALILLRCRTAFAGGLVATGIILNNRYQLLKESKKRWSKFLLLIFGGILLCLLAYAVFYLYNLKRASADGRAFIWKICMTMVPENPITGIGYGRFEQGYNLAQAQYFAHGKALPQEITNASYVHMAYNEFLESMVEGGALGLLLFSSFLAALLLLPLKTPLKAGKFRFSFTGLENACAYGGIAAFTVMSLLNFTVQAIPVMGLMMCYGAYCMNSALVTEQNKLPFFLFTGRLLFSHASVALLCSTAVYTCLSVLLMAKAYRQNKDLPKLAKEIGTKAALNRLKDLEQQLSGSALYWQNYGNLLYVHNKFALALDKLNKAKTITSDPDLYLLTGNCYRKMGDYKQAEQAYLTAKHIQPHRFAPQYALMKLYANTNDTGRLLQTATGILAMNPKIPSDKVVLYKQEASAIISKIKAKPL